MSTIVYRPVLNGALYDPVPFGGSVSQLALYSAADYSDPSPATSGPAVRIAAGVYEFTVPAGIAAGRYWPEVTWTQDGASFPVNDRLPAPLDLPVRDDMVISAEALAAHLGIALPLDAAQRADLTDAVLDAQADVVGYLGRRILPELIEERRLWLHAGGWVLAEQPVVEILSEVEEFVDGAATGYWTVSYRAGLDAKNDPELRPIRRVVMTHAAAQPAAVALWRAAGAGAVADVGKRIKAVSAEGQSISYDFLSPSGGPAGPAAAGAVGGAVQWSSIDRWRVAGRRVYQRKAPALWVR